MRAPRGMMLIEVLVVLVILGMIAGTVAVSVFGAKARADRQTARMELERLADAVDTHRLMRSALPPSLESLVPEYLARLRPDPWGHAYVLVAAGTDYEVVSYGADGEPGGDDDLRVSSTGGARHAHGP